MTTRPTVLAAALFLAGSLGVSPASGTVVKIFQTQSQAGFLAGTLEGVSVDSLGRMELAPKAERVTSLSEPFLLSSAVHPDGWVAGTGNAGKVLLIDRKGQATELFTAPEPEVFAVWADPDGTVYAGTSPQGKVYRIPRGAGAKGEVFFEPGETYIWKLARGADGSLLVGTGTQGKLFKVDSKGKGQVLYDSDDTHVRALEVLPGGDVLLGTAGEGLILRLGKDGQARTLYDADQPEVVALAAAPDGTCYAAVVSSEASLVDLSKPAQPASGQGGQARPGEPAVSVSVEGEAPESAAVTGTRREGATGARSEILSISPVGVVESLWSFNEDTVYSLLFRKDRLWVATGLDGKLYSYADAQMLLEKDVDERQIVALLPGDPGPAFATTNAAALYRITEGTEKAGTYTSAALDAQQVARFGSFRWRGEAPAGGDVRFSFRSGVSAEPDRTWSAWTEPREGQEISLNGVPLGRYVQWRAELRSGSGASPRLYSTELSYRQENLSPKIGGLLALDAGQILVPANFNPSNQVYEPAHPNREGIFTSLTPASDDDGGGGRTKPLWKIGYQTLRWSGADPNGDQLTYELAFRPEGKDGGGEGGWLTMASDLTQDYYSFDATALPDGVYRFRLKASDHPSNEPESALTAERVSDPVVIDHAPPALAKTEVAKGGAGTNGTNGTNGSHGGGQTLRVTVRDESSPLREAVYSVNAAEWKPVVPADGLIDGRTETLLIEAGEPGSLVLLRVTDAAHNVITFNLTQDR